MEESRKRKRPGTREEDVRAKGLAEALPETNKGFSLLKKFGFQEGQGLGSQGQGRTEPVPIEIKAGRGGLGLDAVKKQQVAARERAQELLAKRAQVREVQSVEQFRRQQREKFAAKRTAKDLYAAQKACLQLDQARGIESSDMWPMADPAAAAAEGESADDEPRPQQSDFASLEVNFHTRKYFFF